MLGQAAGQSCQSKLEACTAPHADAGPGHRPGRTPCGAVRRRYSGRGPPREAYGGRGHVRVRMQWADRQRAVRAVWRLCAAHCAVACLKRYGRGRKATGSFFLLESDRSLRLRSVMNGDPNGAAGRPGLSLPASRSHTTCMPRANVQIRGKRYSRSRGTAGRSRQTVLMGTQHVTDAPN